METIEKIVVGRIIKALSEIMAVPVDEIRSRARHQKASLARQISMYMAHRHGIKISHVAKLHNRHHGAAIHARKSVAHWLVGTDYWSKQVQDIVAKLKEAI